MYIIPGLLFSQEEEEDLTASSVAACYSLSGFLSPRLSLSIFPYWLKLDIFLGGEGGGGNQMSNSRDTPLLI